MSEEPVALKTIMSSAQRTEAKAHHITSAKRAIELSLKPGITRMTHGDT